MGIMSIENKKTEGLRQKLLHNLLEHMENISRYFDKAQSNCDGEYFGSSEFTRLGQKFLLVYSS